MGMVYLAEQGGQIRRKVALKIIKPGMDSKRVIARFENERQALALLDHPNIAQVYDADTTEQGRPYFVMEHVRGMPITEYCDRHRLSIEDRLRLFQQVCLAVHHAHQKGIIHRDLKPSNILVSAEGDRAAAKIIDFGVAKAMATPLTERTLFSEDSQLLGTPEYMSPEQADVASEDIDTRSDIYSLGVLLYVLLSGILPYDSETFRQGGVEHIRKIIRTTDPKTPSTRLTKLGEEASKLAESRRTELATLAKCLQRELEWIPLKAMRKERAERYRSASEVADDIDNYLNGEPLIAGPPGTGYKLKKFVRRNRALVSGIAVVLVVLVAGITVSTVLAMGQMRALAMAKRQADLANSVLGFLTNDVLMSADRSRAGRWQVTLSDVLDVASENLGTRFRNEPLVEATIRHTLGNTYLSLGKYPAAEPHIESACRIRRTELGQEHPDTLASTVILSELRVCQGKYVEAEHLSTTVVETRQRLLGRAHSDTLASMGQLAVVYWYQRRYAKAETLFSEVWELHRQELGEDHPDTLGALSGVVWTYLRQRRYAEAEPLAEHVFQTCLETLGEDHYMTQGATDGVVEVYTARGRLEGAEEMGRKGLELKRRALGEEHPETLESMGLLARVYARQGRYDEAAQLYEAVHETQRRLSMQYDKVLRQLVGLANLYVQQARYGEAEPLLQQELRRRERQFGPDHPHTLDSLRELVHLYESWNKPDEAEQYKARLRLVNDTYHEEDTGSGN
jgi:serine/threonine protein kinase